MSDADDADLQAQCAQFEEQWEKSLEEDEELKAREEKFRKENEELQARQKDLDRRQKAWRKEREKEHQAALREIERIKKEKKTRERILKLRAGVFTIVGAATGVALIWGTSQTTGFWSLLMNALGTGLLFVATVAVAAYFVSRYWKTATETPNDAILSEIFEVHRLLIYVYVAAHSSHDVVERLRMFLILQEGKEQAEREAEDKQKREIRERVGRVFRDYIGRMSAR